MQNSNFMLNVYEIFRYNFICKTICLTFVRSRSFLCLTTYEMICKEQSGRVCVECIN